ncbi:MAG: extracellular solute-binding protein [Planctomycetaceae bacterium]
MLTSEVCWSRTSLLVATVSLAMTIGCNPQPATRPSPELPFAGQTVEIAVPRDLELHELWQPILQEWQAATGATVSWSEFDLSAPPWQSGAEIPAAGRVLVVPLSDLASADAAGGLQPLPATTQERIDDKDIFIGLKESTLCRDKKLIAVPISAPTLLCYYRADLLSAAGGEPPRTWDDYQQLIDEIDQWAPQLSAWEPCGPEFRASLFLARATAFCKHSQNYSLWFDIQTGEPLFDTPGFERALETAQAAWKKMPAEVWTATPEDCRQALLAGRAALALTWEPSASYPRSVQQSQVVAEQPGPVLIGAVRLPGADSVYQRDAKRWESPSEGEPNQPGFVGFTGLALGVTGANDTAAAWSLFESLVGQLSQAFAERPRSPCRESEMGLAWFGADGTLSPETAASITEATAASLRHGNVVCDLALPHAHAIREILTTELARVKDGSAKPQDVLAAINSQIAAATQADRTALRAAYRRSLGLSPIK